MSNLIASESLVTALGGPAGISACSSNVEYIADSFHRLHPASPERPAETAGRPHSIGLRRSSLLLHDAEWMLKLKRRPEPRAKIPAVETALA
jgi:hypothetical protein